MALSTRFLFWEITEYNRKKKYIRITLSQTKFTKFSVSGNIALNYNYNSMRIGIFTTQIQKRRINSKRKELIIYNEEEKIITLTTYSLKSMENKKTIRNNSLLNAKQEII